MDCSPLGSSIHGISQARILEWVAISLSWGCSWPRGLLHCRQILYCCATKEAPISLCFSKLFLCLFCFLCFFFPFAFCLHFVFYLDFVRFVFNCLISFGDFHFCFLFWMCICFFGALLLLFLLFVWGIVCLFLIIAVCLFFFFAISLGFCLFVFIPSFFNFIFSLFAKLCSLQILGSQARGRA